MTATSSASAASAEPVGKPIHEWEFSKFLTNLAVIFQAVCRLNCAYQQGMQDDAWQASIESCLERVAETLYADQQFEDRWGNLLIVLRACNTADSTQQFFSTRKNCMDTFSRKNLMGMMHGLLVEAISAFLDWVKWHWSEADAELYCSSILSLFNRLSHEANLSMVLVRATDSSNRFVKLLTSNSAAAKGKEYRPSICQLCGSVSPVPRSFCCPSSWTSSTTICCPNSWAFSSSVLLCRLLHPQDNHHFH